MLRRVVSYRFTDVSGEVSTSETSVNLYENTAQHLRRSHPHTVQVDTARDMTDFTYSVSFKIGKSLLLQVELTKCPVVRDSETSTLFSLPFKP
jgi:hypothetical protein